MNQKVLIVLVVIVAVAAGYFLGSGRRSANAPTGSMPAAHDEPSAVTESRIPGAHHVHAIAYDHAGQLLLGTHGGLFRSVDGGRTWQKVAARGSVNAGDWMSLVADPRDRKVIFAGGHDLGVIQSTDGGITWVRADNGIRGADIHGLAINQRNPALLFAYSVGNGMFRSEDGGKSWKRMDDGPENPGVRSLGYVAVQTSMDRSMGSDNWGLLFAGTADGLSQSFSCFCGWTETTETFRNTTVYALATLHRDLTVMYAGTKDGAWKTTDAGQTWRVLGGLNGVKISAIAINPENSSELTAASEGGVVYQSGDAGERWQQVN